MIVATILIALLYSGTLIYFVIGYKKVGLLDPKEIPAQVGFSIIIPFRNEQHRLQPLLTSLLALSYPAHLFEVIFIDDSSTDGSVKLIEDQLKGAPFRHYILKNVLDVLSPKKEAIKLGISKAQYKWILTTDADCKLPTSWLYAFNDIIVADSPDFVAAPVRFGIGTVKGLLPELAQIETTAILVTTIGSYGHKQPILANGANLGYKKAWFEQVLGFKGNLQIASGDDVFMLQKAISSEARISYLKSHLAVVQTKTETNLSAFLSQRIRWASKTTAVKNSLATFVGLVIAMANLWWLVLLFSIYFLPISAWYFAAFVMVKLIVDFWYVSKAQNVTGVTLNHQIGLIQVLYPFVLLYIILGSLIGGYRWKNRRFKK